MIGLKIRNCEKRGEFILQCDKRGYQLLQIYFINKTTFSLIKDI